MRRRLLHKLAKQPVNKFSIAKFIQRPWEFDIGWMYNNLLERYKLATLRKQSV